MSVEYFSICGALGAFNLGSVGLIRFASSFSRFHWLLELLPLRKRIQSAGFNFEYQSLLKSSILERLLSFELLFRRIASAL